MENLESTRACLFDAVLIQLDSAAGEGRAEGSPVVVEHVEACLIPFVEAERDRARKEAAGRR
jgi:hypothetical protein